MRVLLDRDEVANMIEEVTNEAIEKRKNKAYIQRALILELSQLEPINDRDNDDNIELALQGLKLFLRNWCMNVKKTKKRQKRKTSLASGVKSVNSVFILSPGRMIEENV